MAQHGLVAAIRAYQVLVSPLLHLLAGPLGGCRFHPTCSVYALEAVRRHGALRGSGLAIGRLCRCHPWGAGGDDPVPEAPAGDPGAKLRATLASKPRRRFAG